MQKVGDVVDPPASGGGIDTLPVDVVSIIIVYAVGGYMKFDLSNNALYSKPNKEKARELCKLRLVNKHMWRCVTHYILLNTAPQIIYREFATLCKTQFDSANSFVQHLEEMALFKLCEHEAGKDAKKRSLVATLYLYLTRQGTRLVLSTGWNSKHIRTGIESHFKQLCIHKRGEYCSAFKVYADAVKWMKDAQQANKSSNHLRGINNQIEKFEAQIERLVPKRVRYEEASLKAEKAETESLKQLEERAKKIKTSKK